MKNNTIIPVYTVFNGVSLYDDIPFVKATDIMKFLGYSKSTTVDDFYLNNYRKYNGTSELGYYWASSGNHNIDYEYDDFYFSKDGLIDLLQHIKKPVTKKKEILVILGLEQ